LIVAENNILCVFSYIFERFLITGFGGQGCD